jgi:hypothetical protein
MIWGKASEKKGIFAVNFFFLRMVIFNRSVLSPIHDRRLNPPDSSAIVNSGKNFQKIFFKVL